MSRNWPVYHQHVAAGRYYGYPECCVQFFAEESALGHHGLAEERGVVYLGEDKQYVPCDACQHKAIPFEIWMQALCFEVAEVRREFLEGYCGAYSPVI